MPDTCAILSKAYGEEDTKMSSAFVWHEQFKESLHVEITHDDNVYHLL
jgi:hypothetical protein